MDEVNFLHVNKQIMKMNFQHHLLASLSFLQMNQVVCRRRQTTQDSKEEANVDVVQPSTQHLSTSSKPSAKKKKHTGNVYSVWHKCSSTGATGVQH